MKIVRVEYIVALTGEDGKTELVNKERILFELDSIDPGHDLFVQHLKLTNTLRILAKEEVLDHSGLDYYEGDLV